MSKEKFNDKKKNEDKASPQKPNHGSNSSNSRGGNRRRFNSKRKPKKTEVDISDADINAADLKGVAKSTENDGSWYSHYPELVNSFGSIPFSYPLGSKLPIPDVKVGDRSFTVGTGYIPGIMALKWYPVIGQASGYAADAVNQAANKIYVYVRHTLSTYANYDPSDMIMYILAMDSIYTLYSELVRAYGVAMNWKVLNKYYAKAVIRSLGFEPNSILDNPAKFRGLINEIAYMLNQFVVPAGFDYITRHTWMASNLFYDGEAVKSQTYLYKCCAFYELTEVTDGPMYLKFTKKFQDGLLTADQAIAQLKRCVSLVMNSQDCIAMSGDLLKAFGPSGTFVALPVQENYVIEPTYSKEVLSQIENATILGYPVEDRSNLADQWSGDINQMTVLTAGPNIRQVINIDCGTDPLYVAPNLMDWLLNFHTNVVSPVDVMIATRLTNIAESYGTRVLQDTGATVAYLYFANLGSEVLAECDIYLYEGAAASTQAPNLITVPVKRSAWGVPTKTMALWSMFDWAPRMLCPDGPKTGTDILKVYMSLDVDNYAVLSKSDLAGLHNTALLSLFEVPSIAKLAIKRFEPKSK